MEAGRDGDDGWMDGKRDFYLKCEDAPVNQLSWCDHRLLCPYTGKGLAEASGSGLCSGGKPVGAGAIWGGNGLWWWRIGAKSEVCTGLGVDGLG